MSNDKDENKIINIPTSDLDDNHPSSGGLSKNYGRLNEGLEELSYQVSNRAPIPPRKKDNYSDGNEDYF